MTDTTTLQGRIRGPYEEAFFEMVDANMARGMSRDQATARVVHEHGELHRRMIAEANANRRAR